MPSWLPHEQLFKQGKLPPLMGLNTEQGLGASSKPLWKLTCDLPQGPHNQPCSQEPAILSCESSTKQPGLPAAL